MLNILADHSAVCPFINAELFLKKFNAWGQCGECTVILSFFSLCVLRRTEERMATLTQKTKKSALISGGTMSYRRCNRATGTAIHETFRKKPGSWFENIARKSNTHRNQMKPKGREIPSFVRQIFQLAYVLMEVVVISLSIGPRTDRDAWHYAHFCSPQSGSMNQLLIPVARHRKAPFISRRRVWRADRACQGCHRAFERRPSQATGYGTGSAGTSKLASLTGPSPPRR